MKSILIGILIVLVVSGCKKDDPVPVDTSDKISITGITPLSSLANGASVDFTVSVSYNLYKTDTGTILIGFNNGSTPSVNVMISSANKVINKGSGQYTFTVKAQVVNWGTQSDFHVYVNLSPNPLPTSWTPYSNDTLGLIAKQ